MAKAASLEIGLRCSAGVPALNVERLEALLTSASLCEKRHGEIGVWICTDDEIADLHLRFMDMPGATDVMSFPGDALYLGDIAVSYETAIVQAAEAGHSVAREIAYLALHGLLHLFGEDDLTAPERERMLAKQDTLIESFERSAPGDWD